MFVRQKRNKSGIVSVQIIDKSSGKYCLYQTVGSSSDKKEIDLLVKKGNALIQKISGQEHFYFDKQQEEQLVDLFFNGINALRLVGPELLLGKLFNEIGFNIIEDELFRHLVITRLCYPVSKLKTTDYLFKYQGLTIDVENIYRYLDKLQSEQKKTIQQISYTESIYVIVQ